MNGTVYLIGAGPGDPGLMTCKGLDCLVRADVIIYDHLVNKQLLDIAPESAARIYAGKSAGCHAMSQDEINRLLVSSSREGKAVVRLKGGDPFVLGRGGEEAETLAKCGVPFEIVPGVTSAVAAPAYAGIPVTHRELASSFAVIAGHEDLAKSDSRIQWAKLATGVDTLVFLMGMQNLPEIVARLVEHGRAIDTPVAVVQDGTGPLQKTVVGTLRDIVDLVKENGMVPPAVVVVGEVVRLRETIRWFDNRPLFGKRILVTRASHQASTMSKALAERGALPVELPAITIQRLSDDKELKAAILNLGQYQWIVFTSVNGVEAFFDALVNQKLDSRALSQLIIGAIGPSTAEALRQKGIVADFQPDIFTSEGLIAGLKQWNIAGQRFLLPRADIAGEELVQGLVGFGALVQEIAVYRTSPDVESIAQAKEMLLTKQIDVITFTSSSTVTNLITALGDNEIPEGVKIACIGPKTAETAIKAGLKPDVVAKEHNISGLIDSLEEFFRKAA
ncbi:MAG: uroporphyrinogen-III C-methyltransferase [Chloroflexi bacterium RBG_16_56_11]|nr:MAG: uroporphyrinogen-III C-methyltransferase [Chloroflexi bacterium RBG_16_56_11]